MNIVLLNIKNQGYETVAMRRPFIVSFMLLLKYEFSLMSLTLFLYFLVLFFHVRFVRIIPTLCQVLFSQIPQVLIFFFLILIKTLGGNCIPYFTDEALKN